MLVYNRQHPLGVETGSVLANGAVFPDRLMLASGEQSRWVAERRASVDRHERTVLHNSTPLPRDAYGIWDREGVQIQRDILAVFGDLASSVSMPMPIGKIVHYFMQVSDSGEAHVSLDGRSKGRTDAPVLTYKGTPLPIIDSTFSFGWRMMETARLEGYAIDADARANAFRKVAEQLETIALSGLSNIVVGGNALYGLTNHPQRNTRATTNDLSTCTGAQWLADVNATLQLLHADDFRSPATLYVNWDDWFYASQTDYSTAYPNKTIAQRVLENGGIREIIPASRVSANTIIAVIKDRNVLQVLNGMPINTRQQFRANPEDDYNFVVMAAAALEIKYDAENNCGIAHSS